MNFTSTSLHGAYLVDLEERADARGFFARTYCQNEFAALGLTQTVAQCNVSFNHKAGTLRGMHWRAAASPEAKLVRVTRGAIYDVIVDMRADSPTYLQHLGVTLTADNRRALYVPELCAHGFITLEDCTEVFYQMSAFYTGEFDCGARWDDPAFGIAWPRAVSVISERDRTYPDFMTP